MTKIMDLFGESENYKDGEVILREGDTGRDIYALTEAGAKRSRDAFERGQYIKLLLGFD